MSCSASSISRPRTDRAGVSPGGSGFRRRHSRAERVVAHLLIGALVASPPLSATAGEEFSDADRASFDTNHVALDNQRANETLFTIGTDRTTITWQDLQQPANNRLEFRFTNGGRNSAVLNYTESINPTRISGQVVSNGTVGFANRQGVFIDGSAVIDVAALLAVGGNVSREAFLAGTPIEIPLEGRIENHGLIRAEGNVALLATSVLNAGEILSARGTALLVGGQRIELGSIDRLTAGFDAQGVLDAVLAGGEVTNDGTISAADGALLGGRVVNLGEIEIDDGSLLMVGADAVYLSRFDDPVLIRLPRGSVGAGDGSSGGGDGSSDGAEGDADAGPRYAIENHGTIDAGRGHVRLAAADPLGFGIRQGAGGANGADGASGGGQRPRIAARTIELEGGENGRVHLSGELDASDDSQSGRGGRIDVTGSSIALVDAEVDASGTRGGGQIRIGGEQQGTGDLQRARGVVVDEASEIRADATRRGDGGRVIVFAEDLTSVDGAISARGGSRGGDGGFVETSGLRHFAISDAPDVSARRGRAGSWLIDPYDITITNAAVDCADPAVACLDPAIDALLDPEFDDAGFDGILRTIDSNPNDSVIPTNYVSADLIARALGIGTNVTLSTQIFGSETDDDPNPNGGDITIADAIRVDSADIREGTIARLTLLAAGHIFVNAAIEVLPIGSGVGERSNLALSVELHANDAAQTAAGRGYGRDLVEGGVALNADVRTGGGSFTATGISLRQADDTAIATRGGDVTIRTGTVSASRVPAAVRRDESDPTLDDDGDATPGEPEDSDGLTSVDPLLELLGLIDTRTADGREDGGDVSLTASSANLTDGRPGPDPVEVVTGLLRIGSELIDGIFTGGGDVALAGGVVSNDEPSRFAGDVEIAGVIDTARQIDPGAEHGSGIVAIRANRVNPDRSGEDSEITSTAPQSDPARGQGGQIRVSGAIRTNGGALAIGNDTARSLELDGTFDTTHQSNIRENGLVQLIARDSTGVDAGDDEFGDGRIEIGTQAATTIATAGLAIRTRELVTSDATTPQAVDILLSGRSSSTFFDATANAGDDDGGPTADAPEIGVLDIEVRERATLNANTELSAETIRIVAAPDPTETANEALDSMTRLVFGGLSGGAASAGVRLNANEIRIAVGDGTTATGDLFEGEEQMADPDAPLGPEILTDLGQQRRASGDYRGLQMRGLMETGDPGAERPDELEIRQDASLTIVAQGTATAAGELDLEAAFGGVDIGEEGMRLALESSDGILRVNDAAGFNNAGPQGGQDDDAGKSFVTLRGGLLLPTSPGGIDPDPESVPTANSVVFRDGVSALGADDTTAFTVESLDISTPGDLTIGQQVANSLATVAELFFTAGRDTGEDDDAGRGTLTIDAATSLAASRQLSLAAGDAGFGDLVFAGAGTTLAADEIELRAGSTGQSRNADSTDRSRIVGLQAQGVSLRDAGGATFGDAASSATAFRYRQAAGVDAAVDLPTLAQFGLSDVGPTAGFRAAGDVEYAVRSDHGSIDLDDGVAGTNEADRFRNSALSLIGEQSGSQRAILVSADTSFVGRSVELGGVGAFTFDANLARVFNRSGLDAGESITLRSGLRNAGGLSFSGSDGNSVTVKAPTIRLIAGDGTAGNASSTIDTRNAAFDLAGPLGTHRTFAYQIDGDFRSEDLPSASAFVGGTAGLPSVLAIRNDGGRIDFDDFDLADLPIAALDALTPARLVLEAEAIQLEKRSGGNLELTASDIFLRLRANVLSLFARGSDEGVDRRVVMRQDDSSAPLLFGTDSDFDAAELLAEAFDPESDEVTTANLSETSEDPDGAFEFDLRDGRGPTTLTVRQDGEVRAAELAHRNSFSGQLARTLEDDDEDLAVATVYTIESRKGRVELTPENVNGSNLFVVGSAATANDNAIDFAQGAGLGVTQGLYTLDSLRAQTEDSIVIGSATRLHATDGISLVAAAIGQPDDRVDLPLGSIRFEGSGSELRANTISLAAGPSVNLTNPDGNDADDDRDEIDPSFLPKLDLTGLDSISFTGDPDTSLLLLRQNGSFDTTSATGDFISALAAGVNDGVPRIGELVLTSVQGLLTVSGLDVLANEAERLVASTGSDGRILVEMPNQTTPTPPTPFDDFEEGVRIESDDITFRTLDPGTSIDLATDKLLLVSRALERISDDLAFFLGIDPDDAEDEDAGRLRSDMEQDDDDDDLRPIVRIQQVADFTNSELPRPTQYATIDAEGTTVVRRDLSGLDIELSMTDQTAGSVLTLDNMIRSRATGTNLILRSAGDVAIDLDGRTPGYQDLPAYADLQLGSLDIQADGGDGVGGNVGAIRVDPFTIDAAPADLTLETVGDQRFGGRVELANTLVTTGRDIVFESDVLRSGPAAAGLVVGSSGQVRFRGDVGAAGSRLDRLWILFDGDPGDASDRTPNVLFDRGDENADGIREAQAVYTENDILLVTSDLPTRTAIARLTDPDGDPLTADGIGDITDLAGLDALLDRSSLGLGRDRQATFATLAKQSGDLRLDSSSGIFAAGAGEKLSVGGTLAIAADALAAFSDAAALRLEVAADAIGLVRRAPGVTRDALGQTHRDGGPSITANEIDFGLQTPSVIGRGRGPRFGLPDPFAAAEQASFLDDFPVFAVRPGGRNLSVADFRFRSGDEDLDDDQVPFVMPTGASRSDLSGAFGPVRVALAKAELADPKRLDAPERLRALAVEARPTPDAIVRARLAGVAVIDDRALASDGESVVVTEARLDAADAEAAIALYSKLFGEDDARAGHVRGVLQQALDEYLEIHRAQRVIGFELRRFVKNRPSTLIEAYTTLEDLDALFRYHRRLGLSPGEYKRIQRGWLRKIQPEGIALEELAETVHPSRYVRGSDILDIFGQ